MDNEHDIRKIDSIGFCSLVLISRVPLSFTVSALCHIVTVYLVHFSYFCFLSIFPKNVERFVSRSSRLHAFNARLPEFFIKMLAVPSQKKRKMWMQRIIGIYGKNKINNVEIRCFAVNEKWTKRGKLFYSLMNTVNILELIRDIVSNRFSWNIVFSIFHDNYTFALML